MRSEPTSAPICRENQSFPRFIAKGKDFLLTQFYFSDVEAVLAGYIWGAIAHAQVRSCTEIMTRDYLNGYQVSAKVPCGEKGHSVCRSFSEVLGCNRSQSGQTGAGWECVVGRGGSRGGEGCTVRRKKKISAGPCRGVKRSTLFHGNRQLFLVGSMSIISKWLGASA